MNINVEITVRNMFAVRRETCKIKFLILSLFKSHVKSSTRSVDYVFSYPVLTDAENVIFYLSFI